MLRRFCISHMTLRCRMKLVSLEMLSTKIWNRAVNNKELLDEVFCDIQNNQGWSKGYLPKPKAETDLYFILCYFMSNGINGSHVFASLLTGSNAKPTNLTWLPVTLRVSLTLLLYNLQLWHHRHWFWKFSVCFWPIRKELESSMTV